ncbi:MAG: alkylation response protein AidB-like acyl-CoA dehydrogenase [Saprospiraceae bacterium]|jgi:alkylation response protein AidB-like acyl-CoA dehydrogenase
MSLVLNDEQQMLRDAAAAYFSDKASVQAFRDLRKSDQSIDNDSWQRISEFGWPAILAPEALGGLGFGVSGLGLIAIEAGKNLTVSPLFSSAAICMTALLQCEPSSVRDALIQSISDGKSKCVLVHTENHRFEPQAIESKATQTSDGYQLNGSKAYVAEGGYADTLLVVAELDSKVGLFVVDANASGLSKTKLEMMDRRDYVNVTLDNVQVVDSQMLKWSNDSTSAIDNLTNVGALMAAAELYGCALEAFERTRVYLGDREQFGRKIGSFQALQHRMAHAFTQLELLKSVLFDAMHALEKDRKDASLAVSHVKTLANSTARLVTQEAIQMHGGIGITDELDIGLFYKRARVLQAVYGDSNFHKNRFANLSGY